MLVLWNIFSNTVQVFQNVTCSKVYMLLNFSMKIKTCKGNSKIHMGVTNFTDLFAGEFCLFGVNLPPPQLKFPSRAGKELMLYHLRRGCCFHAGICLWEAARMEPLSVAQLPALSSVLSFLPALVEWSGYVDSYSYTQVLLCRVLLTLGLNIWLKSIWPLQGFRNFIRFA